MTVTKEQIGNMNPDERKAFGAELFGRLLARKPELRLDRETERVVNPERLTKFDRTDDELLRLLFFSVAVAGKTAKSIAIKCNGFFNDISNARLHLHTLSLHGWLRGALEAQRMGKYSTLENFVLDFFSSGINLKTCSVEDLEQLHGVGPKTARMFLLHSRPNQRFAVLDTHVLKFIAEVFPDRKFPKATPSGKQYLEIEALYLELMKQFEALAYIGRTGVNVKGRGIIPFKTDVHGKLNIAAFDLDLWRLYSGNKDDYAN